jgi:hypothetical protein
VPEEVFTVLPTILTLFTWKYKFYAGYAVGISVFSKSIEGLEFLLNPLFEIIGRGERI